MNIPYHSVESEEKHLEAAMLAPILTLTFWQREVKAPKDNSYRLRLQVITETGIKPLSLLFIPICCHRKIKVNIKSKCLTKEKLN